MSICSEFDVFDHHRCTEPHEINAHEGAVVIPQVDDLHTADVGGARVLKNVCANKWVHGAVLNNGSVDQVFRSVCAPTVHMGDGVHWIQLVAQLAGIRKCAQSVWLAAHRVGGQPVHGKSAKTHEQHDDPRDTEGD